jgi:opacity protein-like surface antigen
MLFPAVLFLPGLCLIMAFPCPLVAAEHAMIPDIRISSTYDDNLFFDEVSDFELRTSPTLNYQYMQENGYVRLNAGADIYRYVDKTQYDRVNHAYNLDINQQLTPTLAVMLDGGFAVDHTFETELEETGVATNKSRRYLMSTHPGISWDINARNTLLFELGWNRTDYRQASNTDNRDYDAYLISLSLFREWTERLTLVGNIRFSLTEVDDLQLHIQDIYGSSVEYGRFDQTHHVYQTLLGVEYQWTENLNMSFRAGGGLAQITYDEKRPFFSGPFITGSRTTEESYDDFIFLFGGRLDWEREVIRLGLEGNRQITQSSDGESIENTRFKADASYDLSELITFHAQASFVRSKSVAEESAFGSEVDSQSYAFSPGVEYKISPNLSLGCRYEIRVIDDFTDNDYQKRNRIWAELRYNFPYFL